MDRTVVSTGTTNHEQDRLTRSFNDLNCGQELRALKPSLASYSGNVKEQFASFPSITLPKISPARGGKDELNSVSLQLSSAFPRLDATKKTKYVPSIGDARAKQSKTRPQSCTARVPSATSSSQRTPELLRRTRMPRPSLPVALEVDKPHSAPSSPTLIRKMTTHVGYSKALNYTASPQSVAEETDLVDFRRKQHDVGLGSCSATPMSPALLRKFEDSDKTVRKAKNLIDDYKRSSQVQQDRQQRAEGKSLAEAMEEVKNCRYLRVVKRKDEVK